MNNVLHFKNSGSRSSPKRKYSLERSYTTITKPRGYWKAKENQKEFFDQLAIKWNIQKPDDWNKVTNEMVLKEGGNFIANYYNGSLQRGINMYLSK
jgi:hypothetical protein